MDKFIRRTLVTIFLVLFVSVVIYFFPPFFFSLVIAGFVGVALHEFFSMTEKKGIFVYPFFGVIAGSFVPLTIYAGHTFAYFSNLETLLMVLASIFTFMLQLARSDKSKKHIESLSVTLFALFYVAWFFSFFIKLRMLPGGSAMIACLIISTKGADVGAYVGGTKFGKHELIRRISPNKTWEGTILGILTGFLLTVTLGRYLTGISFLHATILGILLPVFGQLGDLAESLIKRDCEVKDSGPVLSAIGGVLDLIDSLLFTAPIMYFYVKTFLQ